MAPKETTTIMDCNDVLWAVDHAKQWMGTTVTQRNLLRAFTGKRGHYVSGDTLDTRLDDPEALVEWMSRGLRARGRWPRLFPVRWCNHYTAWVAHEDGSAVCFNHGWVYTRVPTRRRRPHGSRERDTDLCTTAGGATEEPVSERGHAFT